MGEISQFFSPVSRLGFYARYTRINNVLIIIIIIIGQGRLWLRPVVGYSPLTGAIWKVDPNTLQFIRRPNNVLRFNKVVNVHIRGIYLISSL